jgi:hypothetical protein
VPTLSPLSAATWSPSSCWFGGNLHPALSLSSVLSPPAGTAPCEFPKRKSPFLQLQLILLTKKKQRASFIFSFAPCTIRPSTSHLFFLIPEEEKVVLAELRADTLLTQSCITAKPALKCSEFQRPRGLSTARIIPISLTRP